MECDGNSVDVFNPKQIKSIDDEVQMITTVRFRSNQSAQVSQVFQFSEALRKYFCTWMLYSFGSLQSLVNGIYTAYYDAMEIMSSV